MLRFGWNATAYQIVNPGIAHWFAAGGDAVVGYTDRSGVRVAAGAPVCPPERLADVAAEFEQDASRAGLAVCYFGAEQRLDRLYEHDPGYARVLLGAQPVWRPSGWGDLIDARAALRAQLNRARNKGVVVAEWDSARVEASDELRRCLRTWLATRGLPPLHFLVEPHTLSRLRDRRVFVAERAGTAVAFLVASPVPRRRGWLVEQFVRGDGAPNGTTQMLVDAAMQAFAKDGDAYVTLGLSPLSRRAGFVARGEPLWLRAVLAWVRAHGRRFYNFDGLDAFKARLYPDAWEPVYAIVNRPAFTPRVLYAIAAAFSGGSPLRTIGRGLGRAVVSELRGSGPA